MKISEMQKEIHDNAVQKGFYEKEVNVPEKLMLVASELSEALEAHRNNKFVDKDWVSIVIKNRSDDSFKIYFEDHVKDTFEDELADAMIRIMDLSEYRGIDLEKHIEAKMRYNKSRPYKHNKEY